MDSFLDMGDTQTNPSTNSLHVDLTTNINYIRIPYQVRYITIMYIDCARLSDTRAGITSGLAS